MNVVSYTELPDPQVVVVINTETFLQMAHSLEALQAGRRATLDSTIAKAEKAQVPPEVMSGLRALHAQLSLGLASNLRKGAR